MTAEYKGKTNQSGKRRERVPFSPKASLCVSSSLRHFYRHIFLPENGTIQAENSVLPEQKKGRRSKRAAFCAFSRASITVEAAFALPLFFLCVICMISMINVYGKTLQKASALRDTAMAAALVPGNTEAEQFIDLNVPFLFKPFYLPDGVFSKLIPCRAYVRAWNGRDAASAAEGNLSSSEYVYMTDYGSVYHTDSSCTHLNLIIKSVSLSKAKSGRNEYGARYKPCEKCAKAGFGSAVYITPYGDCYHSSAECAGLKRTVQLVDKNSIDAGICECSRCAAAKAKAA